ncbi:MAG TPA: hypothetical protein VKU00_26835 [Chthonomonadaceae bacterium]|nr:hypothetical protein [Chthonomonadaceae bacterium]
MARVVGRSRPQAEGSTGLKFTEIIVFALLILLAGAGIRYYYQYRKSAGFALQEFFGAVKQGSPKNQYALLDDADKKLFPTAQDYEKGCQLAHGYPERVTDILLEPQVETKDPNEVTIKANISIRDSGEGKELYQGGGSHKFTDTYFMRKNADGEWKVVLSKSGNNSPENCCNNLDLDKATPSPPGQY